MALPPFSFVFVHSVLLAIIPVIPSTPTHCIPFVLALSNGRSGLTFDATSVHRNAFPVAPLYSKAYCAPFLANYTTFRL